MSNLDITTFFSSDLGDYFTPIDHKGKKCRILICRVSRNKQYHMIWKSRPIAFFWKPTHWGLIYGILKLQWARKVLRHVVVKFDFWAFWSHFLPFPPKQCWFFCFFDCADHSAYTTLNWGGGGGFRESTLDPNKMEQMLKYREASFPKTVSTTFVAHCS